MNSRGKVIRALVAASAFMAFVFVLNGCGKKENPQSQSRKEFTQQQLEARFPWDLGSDMVAIDAYPQQQKANYEIFRTKCSQCHTLARPINSPYVTREDWQRYVRRMHLKGGKGNAIDARSARVIVDFLVYDAKLRKIQRKTDFDAETERLQALFKEVSVEKDRQAKEKSEKAPSKQFEYTGDKPNP